MREQAEGAVGVQVPGSCANLGPGFDAFAAAVDVHLVVWTAPPGAERIRCEGEGGGELPTDETNLIWRCFVAYCERHDVPVPEVSLRSSSDIPLERGLGSSAAAAVAGAALARAVTRTAGTDHDLIEIAAAVEGHADNAAAAVLGGIVAYAAGQAVRFEPSPVLRPVVCVPRHRQSTSAARAILPASVPLGDAAANAGHAGLLLAGLTGVAALHPGSMVDRLHEPARLEAMPEVGRLVEALRGAGFAACLSGAGPSVLVVADRCDAAVSERVRDIAGAGWDVRASSWDLAGAYVCP